MTPVLHFMAGWTLLVPDGDFDRLTPMEAMTLLEYTNGIRFSCKEFWESA